MQEGLSMPTEEKVISEIGSLKGQIQILIGTISEVKEGLSKLIALDRAMAEIQIHTNQRKIDIDLLWQKHDSVRKALHDTNVKVDAWINQAKGAAWLIGITLGMVQVLLFAGVTWVFTNMMEVKQLTLQNKYAVEQLKINQDVRTLNQNLNSKGEHNGSR